MFQRISKFCGLLAVLVLLPGVPANAQTMLTGQTEGGAYYTIAVPPTWNGDLVIWNHGYSFSPVSQGEAELGPLAALQLSEGYAVAGSSYRQNQWAVFTTKQDLKELVAVFRDEFGKPDSIIVSGGSLGGIVTADALERADIGNVVGAYPVCGVLAGSRVWNGAFDIRLTYDAVCGDVAPIPGGATGLPEGAPPLSGDDVAIATHVCMGTLAPPAFRTSDQQERMDRFLAVTTIPENFIVTDMFFATNGIQNLIFDPRKLEGGQGLGNIGVTYSDPEVDASIQRVKATRGAAKKLKRDFTPEGDFKTNGIKIVSIHTDKDGLVIVENEKEYQDVVDADSLTVGIIVEDIPTHCGFSEAETVAGWKALTGWLAGAPQPSAADLQGTCLFLEGIGVPGPCRIDPAFVLEDMDGRVAPR